MAAPAAAAGSTAVKRAFPGDSDERGVQPRHFHDGPNPIAAPSDAHAAQADADGPPPAARLYRHALESVFAFLGQGELVTALQVSRDWLAAVKSMASLQLVVEGSIAELRVVAASTMGRHVAVLGRLHVRLSLNADALYAIARLMPHLGGLFCQIDPAPAGEPLSFPAALRELEIDRRSPTSAAELNATLTTVSRLSQLESFTIILPARPDPQISFAPLAALPHLRSLRIYWPEHGFLSDAHLDELRSMPRLHELALPFLPANTLRQLLRQPHDLQWQSISPLYSGAH